MAGPPYNPVPTVQSQGGATPYENLNPSGQDFGGTIARAGEAAGEDIKQAGRQQVRDALELQAQHNETVVLDASSQASKELGELEAQYRQLHGNDAVSQLPDFEQRAAKIGESVGATLKNPDAQRAFHARFTAYADSTLHNFGMHAADQADQAHIKALEGSIDAAKSRLVRDSGIGHTEPHYDELLDSVARLGVKMGWDKDTTTAYLQKQTGDVVQDLVESRIAGGQVYQAKTIFDTAVKENVPGTDVSLLSSDAQARIAHTLHTEIKAQETLARAEASTDAADLMQSDIKSRMITGKPIPEEAQARIKLGTTPKQWEKYQSAAKRADMIYKATGDLRTTPTPQITALVEGLKPAGGELDFEERNSAYQAAKVIADQTLAARKADIAGAAREAYEPVRGAWERYEQNPNGEGLARVAAKKTLDAERALGTPEAALRPLPVAWANKIASEIANPDASKSVAALNHYADQFKEFWPQVFAQISPKLDPALKVAPGMPDRAAQAMLISASRRPTEDLLKAAGVKDQDLNDAVVADSRYSDFKASTGPYGPANNPEIAIRQSIKQLALGYMATQQTDVASAVERASKEILGHYQFGEVNGQTFIAPEGVNINAIEDAGQAVLGSIDISNFDIPGGLPGQTVEDRRRVLENAIRNRGRWVTTKGNTGVTLYSDRGAVTRYGRPVTYTWDQLLFAGQEADRGNVPGAIGRAMVPGAN